MAVKNNLILTGTNGNVWLNGKLLAEIKSIEAKVTGSFEEVSFAGDLATRNVYTGWTGEGTIVLQKVSSVAIDLLADAYQNGIMPDVKIISKLYNPSTGKAERVALSDVVFTEFTLAQFESKALIEDELPFKFSEYEVLEKISL